MLKKYLIVFLVSMVPLIELRGAIPIAAGMGLPFVQYYIPVFDSQKRNKVVQSPSIKALSHFFALLRIIVFFSYLLFDV